MCHRPGVCIIQSLSSMDEANILWLRTVAAAPAAVVADNNGDEEDVDGDDDDDAVIYDR